MSERNVPSKEWIEGKKKEFGRLRSVVIEEETYVYRKLKREEYIEILSKADPNNPAAMEIGDNQTTEMCTVWPESIDVNKMGAGVPTQISLLISKFSGFVSQDSIIPEPEEL